MAQKYVKVFYDWAEVTNTLSDAEKGRLITAIVEYSSTGSLPDLSGAERHLFPMFKAQIDRDTKAYEEISALRSKAGTTGAEAKASKRKQTQANTSKCLQDKDKDKEKPTSLFIPPTLAEVEAYCLERKNGVDAKRFLDYYNAANWVDQSGNKVRNWKQKMIAVWEKTQEPKKGERNAPSERDYTTAPDGMQLLV